MTSHSETIARMDAGSFGKLLIFHLANLSPSPTRALMRESYEQCAIALR